MGKKTNKKGSLLASKRVVKIDHKACTRLLETPAKYEDLTEKILALLFAFNERI
jgi:hypothetical protein